MTSRKFVHVSTPSPESNCRKIKGIYHHQQSCEIFGAVYSICVKVQLNNVTGKWALVTREDSEMCSKPSSHVWQQPEVQYGCSCSGPALYRAQSAARWDTGGGAVLNGPPKTPVNFGSDSAAAVAFTIRSKFDPADVFTAV